MFSAISRVTHCERVSLSVRKINDGGRGIVGLRKRNMIQLEFDSVGTDTFWTRKRQDILSDGQG